MSISFDTGTVIKNGYTLVSNTEIYCGQNDFSKARKDRVTVWEGFNGITDDMGIQLAQWTNIQEDNISFILVRWKCQYIGVKVSDIKPGMKKN